MCCSWRADEGRDVKDSNIAYPACSKPMAVKVVYAKMDSSMIMASLPSQSTVLRSRAVSFPVKSVTKCLKSMNQRTGVARASSMAEPESADAGGGSGMVDADMIVLRKRIQNIRVQECYETPVEWMEWERSAYGSYRADVCLLLSNIESQLLTMRPSVALTVISILFAVLPVASLLFFTALGTQLWTLNCTLLDFIPASH